LSKRMLMKLALGWTDDMIAMNEKMVDEENNRKEATANTDSFGGGGGIPMGDMPMDPGLPLADGGVQAPSMGGGMDGGGMDAGGGGDIGAGVGGGAMESFSRRNGKVLIEDLGLDLPSPKQDMSDISRVPDDESVLGDDRIAGQPIATLGLIQRIRHAQFSKRVDWQKRLKLLNRVYGGPADDGGGMGMGGM
jgi:hypothetical protein